MTIDSIAPASTRQADRSTEAAAAYGAARGVTTATGATTATAVRGATAAAAATPTLDQVTQAVADLNKSPQAQSQGLEFSIDQDSKRTVVKLIDQSTKEVLRQFPTQEALQMAKAIDKTQGMLIQQKA